MQHRNPGRNRLPAFRLAGLLLVFPAGVQALDSADPFAPYLDGQAPEILRELSSTNSSPENITVRRVVFRSRDHSEIFAVIATPKSPGRHPGLLVLHGGGGSAEVDKAMAWAQRGYVAVAPDLPGIAQPEKMTISKGRWSALKYGEGRWVANPDAGASVIFDAVLSAMKSLYLLRAQPEVDPARLGVVGISWGGYMTTMVCALAGDQVRAGLSVYGCGFYELTAQLNGTNSTLGKMPEAERARWLLQLDPGRRVAGLKAAFFIAGAANDFFYWPRAVQATLDAIPGEKNHLFAPNANHKAPVPGGSVFDNEPDEPFIPTPFQPCPTPKGQKANWLAMEVPYFDYHLKGVGEPLPKVSAQPAQDPRLASFRITAPRPLTKVEVYWAPAHPDVMKREWLALPAARKSGDLYEAKLPAAAADWFALVSDDRPVTVASDLIQVSPAAEKTPAAALPLGTLLHQPAPTEVIYKHTTSGDLKLFCFPPPGDKSGGARPAALWIHGGGWTGGTCESFFPLARYTATRGAASFVVEYRLAKANGSVTVGDCLADCKSAVRYLRRHAAELGIDPQRIAVLGESAGGHLAAGVGTLDGFDDPADDLSVSARPDALVLYNPLTDFTRSQFLRLFTNGVSPEAASQRALELSPVYHVRAGQPPTICIHGLADATVSPDDSRRFAAAMKQAGNRCDLVLLPDTPHAFLIPNYKCSEAVVVNSLLIADKFLVSLGHFSGEPNLVVSDPPSWTPKWPPVKTGK